MIEEILQISKDNSIKINKLLQLNAYNRYLIGEIGYDIPNTFKEILRGIKKSSLNSSIDIRSQLTSLIQNTAATNIKNLNNLLITMKNYSDSKLSQYVNTANQMNNYVSDLNISEPRPIIPNCVAYSPTDPPALKAMKTSQKTLQTECSSESQSSSSFLPFSLFYPNQAMSY